jgi:mRNA-degrading endonuclease RelE of RelBE toxin-antitoxin system
MNIQYSKAFIKSAQKLTGKYKIALLKKIEEVKNASSVEKLSECRKLEGFENTYRIRIGSYRAFFIFVILKNTVCFEYLVSRGEAYNKEYLKSLGKKDKD